MKPLMEQTSPPAPEANGRGMSRLLPALAVAAAVSAGMAGLNFGLRRLWRRPLAQVEGRLPLAGLMRPVEVIRDQWGVAHIYAESPADLFYAQGFVQAQDRLFQMDISRRVGLGRLSEIVGPLGLPSDRLARTFGWQRAAAANVAGSSGEAAAMLHAYTGGVNAAIAQGKWPVAYTLLACRPQPWRRLDSAAWGAVLAWGLSGNWETELLRSLLIAKLGADKAADLNPGYHEGYETILPDSDVGGRLAQALLETYEKAMHTLSLGEAPAGPGMGSNNWVVSGERSRSGRPVLANDPHLPPLFPSFWYENHLVCDDFSVTGFTLPGVPGVIIGHNEHVAWGLTNAYCDNQDLYVERFHPHDPTRYEVNGEWREADVTREQIRVRGRRPVSLTVRTTRHGPVISDLLAGEQRTISLRWAAYAPQNHLRAILETNRARDWESFRQGLAHWGFAPQNVVYADVAGNIGYLMPGRVPRRRQGHGLLPVPGWNDDHEWEGFVAPADLPQRFNPPEGIIATANNQIVGSNFPYIVTGDWLPDYRVARIRELLDQAQPLSLADHARIQQDTVSLMARRFLASALPLLPAEMAPEGPARTALTWLHDWNGDMQAEAVAPTLYFGWLVHFSHRVVTQAIGPRLAAVLLRQRQPDDFSLQPFHGHAFELAIRWLESGAPAWVGDIRPHLRPAFLETVAVLQRELGAEPARWQWGRLHQVHLHHIVARVPALGRLWQPLTLPLGGDGYTVAQADVSPHFPPPPVNIIVSCRLLIDVGDWDNSLAALPGGQSGQPASPHYQDGVDDWLTGGYHPLLFSRARVEAAAASRLQLQPA